MPNQEDLNNEFIWSTAKDNLKTLKQLIADDSELDYLNKFDQSALMYATQHGRLDSVQVLLKAGASVDLSDKKNGYTALHMASEAGHLSIMKSLLDAGADINKVSFNGYSPLHVAAYKNNIEVIKELIHRKADVNLKSKTGITALHNAAGSMHPSTEIVIMLLDAGTNALVKDRSMSKRSPLDEARRARNNDLISILEKHINQYPNGVKPVTNPPELTLSSSSILQTHRKNNNTPKLNLTSPTLPKHSVSNTSTEQITTDTSQASSTAASTAASSIPSIQSKQIDNETLQASSTSSSTATSPIPSMQPERINSGTFQTNSTSISSSSPVQSAQSRNNQSSHSQPGATAVLATAHSKINHILPSAFTQEQKLGEGAYGVVFKGEWQHTPVAIKQLKLTVLPEMVRDAFELEAGVMARLRYTHVVQFFGVCMQNPYSIIMEYCAGGSLYNYLHSSKPLEWNQRYNWGSEIGKGLSYLHSQEVIHRDLKSLNVLLNKYNESKLTDFGLAKVKSHVSSMTAKQTSANPKGTLAWMAPELTDMEPEYSHASDVYAYGMVLYELATREVPFHQAANPALIPMWVQKEKRPKIPDDCPKKFADLMTKCWAQRTSDRPSAQEVVNELKTEIPTSPRINSEPANINAQAETIGYASQPISKGYR